MNDNEYFIHIFYYIIISPPFFNTSYSKSLRNRKYFLKINMIFKIDALQISASICKQLSLLDFGDPEIK
jgi:hypothetical protein